MLGRYIEDVKRIAYSIARQKEIFLDEDDMQEIYLHVIRNCRFWKRGNAFTSFLYCLIEQCISKLLSKKSKRKNEVLLEDLLQKQSEEDRGNGYDHFGCFVYCESFHEKMLNILNQYNIKSDLRRLLCGEGVDRALKSVSLSKEKEIGWIEKWLGRELSEEEIRCCYRLKDILDNV
jgi:DNA-directed RNA polymerase specialized sigma24 family protein